MKLQYHQHQQFGGIYIEAAIVLPILLLFVSGIIQYGMYLSARIVLENASQVAVRTAILPHANAQAQSQAVQNIINSTIVPSLETSNVTNINIDPNFIVNGQAATKVEIAYNLPLVFANIIPGQNGVIQINSSAVMR